MPRNQDGEVAEFMCLHAHEVLARVLSDEFTVDAVQTLVKPNTILGLQNYGANVDIDEQVLDYAVRLARKTREFHGIAAGAGPRGAIAIVRAARGYALMAGRAYVTPDDVMEILHPALRHRVILSPEAEVEGRRIDDALSELARTIEVPRL